ncbi:MAG: TniQ family protein, partial [Roseovarius sp.]|nr:TniQ family protein [Roseovarius sp.]
MTIKPLPRRPPPVRDELLSSWIRRRARANHCSVENLCGYLGLGQGRVPELMNDLGQVNWVRFCSAVQRTRNEIEAMALPDTTPLPVQCVSRDDFQVCESCKDQTPGLILRHWRYGWSLTCGNCDRPLLARHPSDGLSDRLHVRAARGATVLKIAIQANDLGRSNPTVQKRQCILGASPELRKAPLIPRYHRNYTTSKGGYPTGSAIALCCRHRSDIGPQHREAFRLVQKRHVRPVGYFGPDQVWPPQRHLLDNARGQDVRILPTDHRHRPPGKRIESVPHVWRPVERGHESVAQGRVVGNTQPVRRFGEMVLHLFAPPRIRHAVKPRMVDGH